MTEARSERRLIFIANLAHCKIKMISLHHNRVILKMDNTKVTITLADHNSTMKKNQLSVICSRCGKNHPYKVELVLDLLLIT